MRLLSCAVGLLAGLTGCGLLLGDPVDAEVREGGSDAGSDDAERDADSPVLCTDRCADMCERTCPEESECGCMDGCACSLSCVPGDNCTSYCRGAETRCEVDGRETSDLLFSCKDQGVCELDARFVSNATVACEDAECDVDCREASNCTVRCELGARCALRCRDASNCGFEICDGEERVCEVGDLSVCNRDCP